MLFRFKKRIIIISKLIGKLRTSFVALSEKNVYSLEKRVRENWEGYASPLHSGIVIVFHKYVAEFCTQQAICRNIYPPHSQTVLYTNGSLKHTLRLQHGMLPCCKKKGAKKKAQEGEAGKCFCSAECVYDKHK